MDSVYVECDGVEWYAGANLLALGAAMLQTQWFLALSNFWHGWIVWSHRLVHLECGYDDGKYCGAEAHLRDR